ncbi:MAG: hypothetical protein ACOC6U_00715 [Thermoplasmatota archaeon]
MKKSIWFALGAIISFSILIRTIPLFGNTLWGIDCGEYVYYTNQWVTNGRTYLSVDGWGQAYPYFPGMLIVSSSFHLLTGLPVTSSTMFVPVILSALSPLFIFLLAHKITRNKKPSLISALFFTVLPPVIYNYSQPKPETLGVLIFLFLLTTIISLRDNDKVSLLLIISSFSLVLTHHLTSYFMILFLVGGFFLLSLWVNKRKSLERKRIYFYIFFAALTVSFWLSVPTFRYNRLYEALIFPSYSIVIVPFLVLLFITLIAKFREKIEYFMSINLHEQDIKRFIMISLVTIIITIVILSAIAFGVFTKEAEIGFSIYLYIPIMFLSLFSLFSRKIIKAYKEGPFVLGWLFFTALSVTAGLIFGSTSLRSIRHVSFFIIPLSLLFGIGIYQFYQVYNPTFNKRKAVVFCGIILILIGLNLPFSYPSQNIISGYDEGTEWDDLETFYWIEGYQGKIATDHRMSAVAFSIGIKNVTWTEGGSIFFSSSLEPAVTTLDELNVSYIVYDNEMKKGTYIEPGVKPKPFNNKLRIAYQENTYILYSSNKCKVLSAP